MSATIIPQLILKDWRLHRSAVMVTLAGGVIGVGLVLFGEGIVGLFGTLSFFISMIIASSILPSQCLINERKQQTLAFLMSLPISAIDYTIAKILAVVGIFMVPWLTLVTAGASIILGRANLSDGLLPLFLVLCVFVLVGMCIISSVALLSESELGGIIAMIAVNISYNFAWILIIRNPAIQAGLKSPVPVWDATILSLLGGELAIIAAVFGLVLFLQSRKKDFI